MLGLAAWIRAGSTAAVALAACGDSITPITPLDAVPLDAATGVADLELVADAMLNSWVVTSTVFADDDCAVIEGCVGASGRRLLLRFNTVTANTGTADVRVGAPPPTGISTEMFLWSPCHMHHHVARYTTYELVGSTGTVVSARKQSFCLEDVTRISPGAPSNRYTCLNQGISRGWADSYTADLPCQWIDVTDLPSGAYTLRVSVNPDRTLPESDYTNNLFSVDVRF